MPDEVQYHFWIDTTSIGALTASVFRGGHWGILISIGCPVFSAPDGCSAARRHCRGGTDAVALGWGQNLDRGATFVSTGASLTGAIANRVPRLSILDIHLRSLTRPSESCPLCLAPQHEFAQHCQHIPITYCAAGSSHRVDIAVSAPLDPTTKHPCLPAPTTQLHSHGINIQPSIVCCVPGEGH